MVETEFTLSGYVDLLTQFLELGYRIVSYDTVESEKSHLILRHDLDMSIQAAIPMAEVERSLGLTSSYFVLLRTEMYNPFSKANTDDILKLLDLGHEVGLHFDASLYKDDVGVLEEAVEKECQVLETLLERPITAVSFHRPAKLLLNSCGSIAGRLHTYQPKFFSEIGYCSDSRGEWSHGHPLDHACVADRRALQLLMHPIWWAGPIRQPQENLNDFLEDSFRRLDEELAQNCDVHEPGNLVVRNRGKK